MKNIAVLCAFIMIGCINPINPAPKKAQVESFEHCMKYDQNIELTVDEELELLEHCLGAK